MVGRREACGAGAQLEEVVCAYRCRQQQRSAGRGIVLALRVRSEGRVRRVLRSVVRLNP